MNWRWRLLAGMNVVGALAGGVFGVISLLAPSDLPGFEVGNSAGIVFYSQMYAVRALVVAAAAIAAVLCVRQVGAGVVIAVLGVAGLIQLGDLAIAVATQTAGIAGSAIASLVHLGSVLVLVRHRVRAPVVP